MIFNGKIPCHKSLTAGSPSCHSNVNCKLHGHVTSSGLPLTIKNLMLKGPGLKHRSHSTGQRYRSLFYQLVTDPNNSPQSKTAFWIVIRARRHFWACLFICSTAACTCTCHLCFRPAVLKVSIFLIRTPG